MIVTLEHLHSIPGYGPKPGWCNGRAREWFARHDLNWNQFRKEGIEAELLLATGCALGAALVQWAEHCEADA
ncbi:hypothetical protein VLF92_24845 [Pseudomonas chengduensis]